MKNMQVQKKPILKGLHRGGLRSPLRVPPRLEGVVKNLGSRPKKKERKPTV